jgi:hypothetical protein
VHEQARAADPFDFTLAPGDRFDVHGNRPRVVAAADEKLLMKLRERRHHSPE